MSLRVRAVLVVAIVAGVCGRVARAEPQTHETIEAMKQLTAPVSRFELRCDEGMLADLLPTLRWFRP